MRLGTLSLVPRPLPNFNAQPWKNGCEVKCWEWPGDEVKEPLLFDLGSQLGTYYHNQYKVDIIPRHAHSFMCSLLGRHKRYHTWKSQAKS